jgi:hypothetical protein
MSMQYNVTLTATVEAPNAEAAKQILYDKAGENAGEITMEAVPTKEWTVGATISTTHSLSIRVNAESAEDAEEKANDLLHEEAAYGDGITGALGLAETDDYEMETLNIEAYDAKSLETDEEQAAELAPATA